MGGGGGRECRKKTSFSEISRKLFNNFSQVFRLPPLKRALKTFFEKTSEKLKFEVFQEFHPLFFR